MQRHAYPTILFISGLLYLKLKPSYKFSRKGINHTKRSENFIYIYAFETFFSILNI
jgi:hypothetical protein